MDAKMGTVDRNYRCQTCSGTRETCPGHFGRMLHLSVIWKYIIFHFYNCAVCARIAKKQEKRVFPK